MKKYLIEEGTEVFVFEKLGPEIVTRNNGTVLHDLKLGEDELLHVEEHDCPDPENCGKKHIFLKIYQEQNFSDYHNLTCYL